ncbi:butyrophilin-like protein 2 [Anableps anableps]
MSDGRERRPLRVSQLKVRDDQVEVKTVEGADSVVLPCRTSPNLPDDARVVWTRSEPELLVAHVRLNTSQPAAKQDDLYCSRTEVNEDLLRTGDLSLTLKFPTDSGSYTCTVYRGEDILRQTVVLHHVKGLVASGGLFYYFRHYIFSVYKVKVDSGAESVLLPCKSRLHLPEDARVDWKNSTNMKVHVYLKGSDRSEEQHRAYHNRTRINEDPLKTRDVSLRLERPLDVDRGTYTCTVCSREGYILLKKDVKLHIRVPQVEVDSGAESVLLPCRATVQLPGDARVEWRDRDDRTVHVYQNGSDQPGEQDQRYRTRTRMDEDLLETGDLSLTLRRPTDEDRNIYTCSVSSRDGDVLMKKQVQLEVKDHQVEVKKGAESVLLPFTTTPGLPGDAVVVWGRIDPEPKMIVHMCYSGSDQPDDQDEYFSTRTRMNEDLLETGDLSLTLRRPTVRDSGEYESCIESGRIWRKKKVLLKVKGTVQVQDQPEDIRTRRSSADPTPLMAEEPV